MPLLWSYFLILQKESESSDVDKIRKYKMAPLHRDAELSSGASPSSPTTDQFSTDVIYGKIGNPSSPHLEDVLGWEETRGDRLTAKIATEVSRIAKSNMETLVASKSYRRLCAESITGSCTAPSESCEFISHSDIELGEVIGEGGFSEIYKIRTARDSSETSSSSSASSSLDDTRRSDSSKPNYEQDEFVIKVLKKEVMRNPAEFALCASDIVKEAVLMSLLDHPHILKVRGMSSSGTMAFQAARRHDSFFVMMDLLGDTLMDRLRSWMRTEHRLKAFSFKQRAERKQQRKRLFQERIKVGTQIADALTYLHEHHIAHRDIKPGNIGFDSEGNAKLFDFDSCRVLPDSEGDGLFRLTRRVGTLRYMAPEVGLSKPYNLKADVYSYALVLYAIVGMREPYIEMQASEQEVNVFHKGTRPHVRPKWPQVIQDLLKSMWQVDCQQRPSMAFAFETLKTLSNNN